MAELADYDLYNNPELANTGPKPKQKKETPIKESPKPVNGPQLADFDIPNYVPSTREFHTGSPNKKGFMDNGVDDVVLGDDLNEQRANRQSGTENMFSSLAKGTGLMISTIGSTFTTLPEGIIRASIAGFDDSQTKQQAFSKTYDNFSAGMWERFNAAGEKAFPVYKTESYDKADLFSAETLGSSQFWGETILKNAGFTAGAIVGGGIVAKGVGKTFQAIGKIAQGAKYLENAEAVAALVNGGMKPFEAYRKVGSMVPYAVDKATQLATGAIVSFGEASMEAKQTKDDTKAELTKIYQSKNPDKPLDAEALNKIDNYASASGNGVLAVNMAVLTGLDTFQFGTLWTRGFKDRVENVGKIVTKDALHGAIAPSLGKRIATGAGAYAKNTFSEAAEEGIQTGTQAGYKDYYARKYDDAGIASANRGINAVLSGMQETFGTRNGWESMLAGAITGIGSHAATSALQRVIGGATPSDFEAATALTKTLNDAGIKAEPYIKAMIRAASITGAMDKNAASDKPSRKAHEDGNADLFRAFVQPYIETGRFDLLEDKLAQEYAKDEDRFKADNGENATRKTGKEFTSKLLKDAKKLKANWDNMQEALVKTDPVIREMLWSKAADIDNRNERFTALNTKVLSQTGVNYDATDTRETYLTKVQEAINRIPIDVNTGMPLNLEEATDVADLFNDRAQFIEQYKSLQTAPAQIAALKAEKEAAEKKAAYVEPPVVATPTPAIPTPAAPEVVPIVPTPTPIVPTPVSAAPETLTGKEKYDALDYAGKVASDLDNARGGMKAGMTLEEALFPFLHGLKDPTITPEEAKVYQEVIDTLTKENAAAIQAAKAVVEPTGLSAEAKTVYEQELPNMQEMVATLGKQQAIIALTGILDDTEEGAGAEALREIIKRIKEDNLVEIVELPSVKEPDTNALKDILTDDESEEEGDVAEDKDVQEALPSYDENNLMSWTGLRNTADYYDAVANGLNSVLRYQNFVTNPSTSIGDISFKVITAKDPLYTKLLNKKQFKYHFPQKGDLDKNGKQMVAQPIPDDAVLVVVVNTKTDEVIMVDALGNRTGTTTFDKLPENLDSETGGILVSTIVRETGQKTSGFNVLSYKHFGRVNGLGLDVTEKDVKTPGTQAYIKWNEHVAKVNNVRVNIANGSVKYLNITDASMGAFVGLPEGLEDDIKLNEDENYKKPKKKNKHNSLAGVLGIDINSKEIKYIIPKTSSQDTPNYSTIGEAEGLATGKKQTVRVGRPYAIYNGRAYPLQTAQLTEKDKDDVVKLLLEAQKAFKKKDNKIEVRAILNKVKAITFIANKKGIRTLSKIVANVNGEYSAGVLRDYLEGKYRNVDKQISEQSEVGDDYRTSLLSGTNPVLTVNMSDRSADTFEPDFLNGYFVYEPRLELVADTNTEVKEPAQEPAPEVTVADVVEAKIDKPKVKRTPEEIAAAREKNRLQLIANQDALDAAMGAGLGKKASLQESNAKENIKEVQEWFKSRFSGEEFVIFEALINGNLFGQYTTAATKLFRGAEVGTGYHEAFHKVTQEYLTRKQLKSLYADARKTVNPKFTDLQVEEYLAEDFRNFVLSGGKAIKGRPITNNWFRKLYNHLKYLLTKAVNSLRGTTNAEEVYRRLASKKGYTGAKKFNVQQFTKLDRPIPETTHQQTQTIVETINGHFFNTLFAAGKTPDELLNNPDKYITPIYNIVFRKIEAAYIMLKTEYDDDLIEEEEYETKLEYFTLMLNVVDETATSLNTLAKDAHLRYLKGLGITLNVKEKSVDKDAEEVLEGQDKVEANNVDNDGRTRDSGYDNNSNEESSIHSAPNSIKLLVMSLPEVGLDGLPAANNIGGPKLNDYMQTMKLLIANMKGLSRFEDMYAKLSEMSSRFPVVRELMKRLGESGISKSWDMQMLENDFRQAFHKFESKGTITLINPTNGELYQVDANANKLRDRIKENWVNNLRGLASQGSEYVKTGDDGVTSVVDNPKLFAMAKAGNKKGFLEAIGVTFTDLDEVQVNKLIGIDEFNPIVNYVAEQLKQGKPVNSLWDKATNEDKEDISIRGTMDKLVDIEMPLSRETIELSYISAEGKRIYAISLNHFYSLTVTKINNAKTLEDLFKAAPHLDTITTRNSVWLKTMFNKKGEKILGQILQMNTVSGLKLDNDVDSGKGATKMEPSDKILQEISDLFSSGTISLIRAADKSSEYALGGLTYRNGGKLAVSLQSIQEEGLNTGNVRNIFFGYFKDELNRIRSFRGLKDAKGEWIKEPLGKGIAIYSQLLKDGKGTIIPNSEPADNYSLFADILPTQLLTKLEPYKDNDEEIPEDLEDEIKAEVFKYLTKYTADNKQYMLERQIGLPSETEDGTQTYTGFSPVIVSDNGKRSQKLLDAAIQTFTVNHLINMIEQSKLMVGDSAFYKDKIKRISAGTGTKKFAASSPLLDTWFNNYYKNGVNRRDKKVADGIVNVTIHDDVKAYLTQIDDYVQALVESGVDISVARKILDAYAKWNEAEGKWEPNMDEGDAQGWITLDEYREFFQRIGGAYWTAEHEKQYQYEIALEAKDKGLEMEDWMPKVLEAGNPNFLFMPIKAQYSGPQVMDGLFAPAFHKYSLAPIYYSLVKGRNMEKQMLDMRIKKVGYSLFGSGSKVGSPLDANGKLAPFYDKEGNMSGVSATTPVQQIYYEYLGVQLDIAPKVKESLVFGSQARKLLFSNLFGETVAPWAKALSDEYQEIIGQRVTDEFAKLIKKLGISVTTKMEGGKEVLSYSFNGDYTKLVKSLKDSLEDKDTADNILDSLQVNDDGSLVYDIDSVVNRPKIEGLLFSVVNSKVIKQKMNGNSLVQLASTGMEPAGKRAVETANYLKFYERGKDGTMAMEVEIPMNDNFAPLLKKYKTIDALNKAISEGLVDSTHITMIGYRIPTQGLNSIDVMTIKRFMPRESGIAIVLPTGVVAKGGGDYDIDKLNVFMPNLVLKERSLLNTLKYAASKLGYKEQKTDEDLLKFYETNKELKSTKNLSDAELKLIKAGQGHKTEDDGIYLGKYAKSSKQGQQNRLIEIMQEVVLHADNFIELTTPNTTDTLTGLVGRIRNAQGQGKVDKPSKTKEFRFDFIMDQFTYFLGGKAALGIAATHNTHHILCQIAKVVLNAKLPFNHNSKTESYEEYLKMYTNIMVVNTINRVSDFDINTELKDKNLSFVAAKKYLVDTITPIILGKSTEEIKTLAKTKYNKVNTIEGKAIRFIADMYDPEKDYKDTAETRTQVDLSGIFTKGGQKITDLISQFINAYVDVAKDPFYKDLNAGTEVTGIWMYLIRAGVDVDTIGYFMTQPIIKEYVNAKKLNESLVVASSGKKKKKEKVTTAQREIAKARLEVLKSGDRVYPVPTEYDDPWESSRALSKKQIADEIKVVTLTVNGSIYNDVLVKMGTDADVAAPNFTSTNINNQLLALITQGSNIKDGKYSSDFRYSQTQMLKAFLDIEKQAGELTLLMQDTNNDTTKLQNNGSLYEREQTAKKVRASGVIPAGTSRRIKRLTIVGSFDISDKLVKMYKELMLYTKYPEVKEAIDRLLLPIYEASKKAGGKDFAKEYTKVQNALVGFIAQKYGMTTGSTTEESMPLFTKISLFSGDNSLAKQLIALNKEGVISDNILIKELMAQVNPDNKQIDNIKMYSRRMTAFESNVISEAFRELIHANDPRIAEFGRDLAYLAILQSGLDNSPITFTELVPFEFYGDIVKGAVDSVQSMNKSKLMSEFATAYYHKQGSSYGFRMQDFGLNTKVPQLNSEQQAEDAKLATQSDASVDTFGTESNTREEGLPESTPELPASQNVVSSDAKVAPTKPTFFNATDTTLKRGSVVNYNDNKYIVWNIKEDGKSQLINWETGAKFTGTPSSAKLEATGSYKTAMYNNVEYIVINEDNVYSTATGNIVYAGEDNSSKVQRQAIVDKASNIPEELTKFAPSKKSDAVREMAQLRNEAESDGTVKLECKL